METKKLTDQELQTIKEIQQGNQALVQELGSIELSKRQISEREENVWKFRDQLIEKEQEFTKSLTETYGDGSVNLEDGTFTPAPKAEEK